jgi:hypothetical protein
VFLISSEHIKKEIENPVYIYKYLYTYIKYACGELYKQNKKKKRKINIFLTFVYNIMLIRS